MTHARTALLLLALTGCDAVRDADAERPFPVTFSAGGLEVAQAELWFAVPNDGEVTGGTYTVQSDSLGLTAGTGVLEASRDNRGEVHVVLDPSVGGSVVLEGGFDRDLEGAWAAVGRTERGTFRIARQRF